MPPSFQRIVRRGLDLACRNYRSDARPSHNTSPVIVNSKIMKTFLSATNLHWSHGRSHGFNVVGAPAAATYGFVQPQRGSALAGLYVCNPLCMHPYQVFLFGGNNSAVVAHSVTWYESGGNTIIQADVNGNTTADLVIVLTGVGHTLTAADFVL